MPSSSEMEIKTETVHDLVVHFASAVTVPGGDTEDAIAKHGGESLFMIFSTMLPQVCKHMCCLRH